MYRYFLLILWAFCLLLSPAWAQSELEGLVNETESDNVVDVEEEAEDESESEDEETEAESDEDEESEDSESVDAEEQDAEIEDVQKTESAEQNQDDNKSEAVNAADSDDFMVQYFNEMDAEEAEDRADKATRDAATQLFKSEPTMLTLQDEQEKLLKISEKRQQEREKRRQEQIEEQKRLEAEEKARLEAEEKARIAAEAAAKKAQEEAEAIARANDPEVIAAKKREELRKQQEQIKENYEKAPFGLYWGTSKQEAEILGFEFETAELENYKNAYILKNPQQKQKKFEPIYVIFGEKDHLNAVYARGIYMKDTPRADYVLKLYDQYYAALKKKYGNDKEYFEPNTYEERTELPSLDTDETGAEKKPAVQRIQIETKDNPRGNENFLQELKEQKASLSATFGGKTIKVDLSIEVNKETQSRIVLDYENLSVQQKDNEATLNELVKDL